MTAPGGNALLGYPDDARLLIINADDFGMCHAANAAISQAIDHGIVTSTSLMVPCPWAHHAMERLKERPDTPFAVHLTLVRDFDGYRWGPVASPDAVPSLVDGRGHFPRFHGDLTVIAGAAIEEVEIEFRGQIGAVIDAGLRPSHLDWHCLADGGREDIFELTLRLAREFGLAMRIHLPTHADHLRNEGCPVVDHPVLDSYHFGQTDKHRRLIQALRELPAGLTEWAVHPSLGNDEARALEPQTWDIRRADFDFVMSADARTTIEEEGIELLDYRALQDIWLNASAG